MDGVEIALLVVASYLAVTGLLRMMLARHREIEAAEAKAASSHGRGDAQASDTAAAPPSQAAA
jgi:hypothetical protein